MSVNVHIVDQAMHIQLQFDLSTLSPMKERRQRLFGFNLHSPSTRAVLQLSDQSTAARPVVYQRQSQSPCTDRPTTETTNTITDRQQYTTVYTQRRSAFIRYIVTNSLSLCPIHHLVNHGTIHHHVIMLLIRTWTC